MDAIIKSRFDRVERKLDRILELLERPVRPAESDADGWIPWSGGSCPVADNTRVDARFRGGAVDPSGGQARNFYWNHPWALAGNPDADIIAYRIHKD